MVGGGVGVLSHAWRGYTAAKRQHHPPQAGVDGDAVGEAGSWGCCIHEPCYANRTRMDHVRNASDPTPCAARITPMIVTNTHYRGVMVDQRLDIAVVGSGIAGLSAAWLLSRRHRVTLYESAHRVRAATATPWRCAAATGHCRWIPASSSITKSTYPNLTALFAHLGVATNASEMSFAVSLDGGALEYAGTDLRGLLAQRGNLVRPRFWSMLRDLRRFYREAPGLRRMGCREQSLGELSGSERLRRGVPAGSPAADGRRRSGRPPPRRCATTLPRHFIRFCENHGLLKFTDRPVWRTVDRRQPQLCRAPDCGDRRPPAGRGRAVDRRRADVRGRAGFAPASRATLRSVVLGLPCGSGAGAAGRADRGRSHAARGVRLHAATGRCCTAIRG